MDTFTKVSKNGEPMPKDGTKTKEALTDALITVVRRGQEQPTVRSVTAQAGMNRQTFYYHFDTLDDLVAHLCETRVKQAYRFIDESEGSNPFLPVCELGTEYRDIIAFILRSRGRPWLKKLFKDDATRRISAAFDEAATNVGLDPSEKALAIDYCVIASASVLEDWITHSGPDRPNPRAVADLLSDQLSIHAAGLAARQHHRS